jgi:hypothetical protein
MATEIKERSAEGTTPAAYVLSVTAALESLLA